MHALRRDWSNGGVVSKYALKQHSLELTVSGSLAITIELAAVTVVVFVHSFVESFQDQEFVVVGQAAV